MKAEIGDASYFNGLLEALQEYPGIQRKRTAG